LDLFASNPKEEENKAKVNIERDFLPQKCLRPEDLEILRT
jgi:hypothetical protein